MNPARSFGPALFAGGEALSRYWIYLVGPPVGAMIAVGCAVILRGRARDPLAQAAGSGTLE